MCKHVRTIFKVYSENYSDGELKTTETRYFATSMDASELSPAEVAGIDRPKVGR